MRWVLMIGAALTLLLPIDLVPDVVPILGWLDDIAAVIAIVYQLINTIRLRRSQVLPISQELPKRR